MANSPVIFGERFYYSNEDIGYGFIFKCVAHMILIVAILFYWNLL
jgi:hypothetical protein